MAGDDGLMRFVVVIGGGDLVEDGDHEDCGLSHAGLGLAEDVLSLECHGDGFDLHLRGMLEAALANGAFEFFLEEEFIPACEVGALLLLLGVLLGLLLVGALVLGHNVRHASHFK